MLLHKWDKRLFTQNRTQTIDVPGNKFEGTVGHKAIKQEEVLISIPLFVHRSVLLTLLLLFDELFGLCVQEGSRRNRV